MRSIQGDIRIDAPRSEVWSLLADLGAIHEFHPGLRGSYYLGQQREGVGAERRCELKPLGEIDERVREWQEGETLALDITAGRRTPPFSKAGGRFTLEDDGRGTRVNLELTYGLRFGWLGSVVDALVVRSQFERTVPAMLKGLTRRAEAAHRQAAA